MYANWIVLNWSGLSDGLNSKCILLPYGKAINLQYISASVIRDSSTII